MLLKFKNLVIRNATADDAEQLATWWNDGTIMAHAGFPNGTGQKAKDIADSLENDRDDFYRRLIIEVSQIPVGEMNYRNKGEGTAEIGIKICDFSLHDRGLGKILLSMLISSLFTLSGQRDTRLSRDILRIFCVVLNRRTSSTPQSSALKILKISRLRSQSLKEAGIVPARHLNDAYRTYAERK